jgi:hypothetical protein
MMEGWIDGGQIMIALESSSGVSSKDVMSISVSHLIWKEEIMNAFKNGQVQEPKRHINKKVAIHTYFIHGTYINRQKQTGDAWCRRRSSRKKATTKADDRWMTL